MSKISSCLTVGCVLLLTAVAAGDNADGQYDDPSQLNVPALERLKDMDKLDKQKFLSTDELNKYFKALSRKSFFVEKKTLGKTVGDVQNELFSLEIGNGGRNVIIIDCGLSGREWLAIAACTYAIQKLLLVFNYKQERGHRFMVSAIDYHWIFLPLFNPDGYDISREQEEGFERNGRPFESMNLTEEASSECDSVCEDDPLSCTGVDLSLNLPETWMSNIIEHMEFPCHARYRGPHPLSEPELVALNETISEWKDKIVAAISVRQNKNHGTILYFEDKDASEFESKKGKKRQDTKKLANAFNKDLHYKIKKWSSLKSVNSLMRGALNLYYKSMGITFSYTIELESKGKSGTGKESLIPVVGKKLWQSLQRLASSLEDYL